MSLTQEEVGELYKEACTEAERIHKDGWFRSKEGFKNSLYSRMRYTYINKYGNLGYKSRNYRHYTHSALARVFKKGSLFSFGVSLDEETAMLNKILDKVTNEHFSDADKAMFDIESMVTTMRGCVTDIESINREGEGVSKELAKVPRFIETGKWDE